MTGWNVKIAAIAGLVSLIATTIVSFTDNDPSTIADWGLLITQATVVYSLFFVRQANVTSEEQAKSGTKMI